MKAQQRHTIMATLEWEPDEWIPLPDMARASGLSIEWLMERIQAEVLPARHQGEQYYLCCASVWRVQQIELIERQFDADPHLAALVTDLMEEVRKLREQLKIRGSGA